MRTHFVRVSLLLTKIMPLVLLWPGLIHAQDGWRLVGVSGQQTDNTLTDTGQFVYQDHTLFEISLTTGALTKMFKLTWVNDSQAVGFCSADGLLYHSGGSDSYSSNPFRNGHDQGGPDIAGVGYQDSQYLESIDLTTRVATAVYNAAPCPNPDPTLPCFGLPGPRPGWVLPAEQRNSTQTDDSFRERGINEYHAIRGMAWSSSREVFYVADDEGIFKLGREGDCTFLSRPAFPSDGTQDNSKGIAFVKVGNLTKLFVGHRNGIGINGAMMEIDPDDGDVVAEVLLTYPPGGGDPVDQFGGLLAIEQHPLTGVLYGIRKTSNNFARELVTINPITGATTLIGSMGMHMASMTFIPPPFVITSVTRSGNDVTLSWSGGVPPYQVQVSPDLSTDSWINSGAPTSLTTATVAISGTRRFIRVTGQ